MAYEFTEREYQLQATLGRLIPSIYSALAELGETPPVDAVKDMLWHIAAEVEVFPIGIKGEVVTFNPEYHRAETAKKKSRVIVVVPGVKVDRGDGSFRVLLPAMVRVVTDDSRT